MPAPAREMILVLLRLLTPGHISYTSLLLPELTPDWLDTLQKIG